MIKALWSFRHSSEEDISRVDLILPLFSVITWKRFHPEHKTILNVDSSFKSKFEKAGILGYWDEVKILKKSKKETYKAHYPSENTFGILSRKEKPNEDGKLSFEIPAEKVEGSEYNSELSSDISMALYIARYILPVVYEPIPTNPNHNYNIISELFWKIYAENGKTEPKPKPKVEQNQSKWDENEERMNIIGQNGNDGIHYDSEEMIKRNEEILATEKVVEPTKETTLGKITNIFKRKK
tara:strand:- start:797 stop:1513 length:717 start_codon:yes stop_codon:yes gene_type:complete